MRMVIFVCLFFSLDLVIFILFVYFFPWPRICLFFSQKAQKVANGASIL